MTADASLKELVLQARKGNKEALQKILDYFKNFTHKFSCSIFIKNYSLEDIIQECNLSIIIAVYKCDLNKYNFASYVICSIRNNMFYKIRTLAKNNYECSLDNTISSESDTTYVELLEYIDNDIDNKLLYDAINSLDKPEIELIMYIFFFGYSIKKYASLKNIEYRMCVKQKNSALNKLKNALK